MPSVLAADASSTGAAGVSGSTATSGADEPPPEQARSAQAQTKDEAAASTEPPNFCANALLRISDAFFVLLPTIMLTADRHGATSPTHGTDLFHFNA
jgi:hypothetical protein